ncbi:DNA-directed RNA polymerase subunit beta' [Deferribacter autotrophicus]|uniref:DNA-directed RNA polymerase subunit beta' n=1 Tax=Deferribacter autotrophicus TaxID=500465 RepID=A0A5A8F6M1_9BACT|nr:DNA-directed RNA polymerase subunit beta' [Deferribacter autotrophicus]KAA0258479.1 DNA-directed RNA polymerase subunit beta' [Deferribacter autotrophicus]
MAVKRVNPFEIEKGPIEFDAIRVRIASPEKIRSWSSGEVTKPETINYRTFKPERDGLFCAKIFGPVKDWECLCGKYKRMKHRGIVCEKCGVEVIQSKVRRERMGHIELATPVAHIWFFKGSPSRIGSILDLNIKDIERVLYFESYIVIDPKNTTLKEKEILSEERYRKLVEEYGPNAFVAKMGAEAIKELLKKVDLDILIMELKKELHETGSQQKKLKIAKRLRVIEGFRKSGNKPEWMILDVIPVIPPELRPLVPLDGGRFATSDLNDLYRRVINRNNRLKKLMELNAPEIIIRNEKRMLQEAVDALFDNGRRGRVIRGSNKRPLKSLSDVIKGKQGRFRQNLLGKRVDYSGRSVIVAGPHLKMHQCGLPKVMALELFKPFLYYKLEKEKGYAATIKQAKKMVEEQRPEVWDILEEVIREHPVLLNRAPTLHRLGIQAFEPVLVEGKAIQLHPLVCPAFNADFDGDQMAVHVPLSIEAQTEARVLMLSSYNILSPAHGRPLAVPTQDMVLGCYYLTRGLKNAKGEGKLFASPEEVLIAYDNNAVDIHAEIKVRIDGKIYDTTVGRVIFYQIVPKGIEFEAVNKVLDKKELTKLVEYSYKKLGNYDTVRFLDVLKDLGFKYATKAGFSICIDDLMIPAERETLIKEAMDKVREIEEHYREGALTAGERYNQIIDVWSSTNDKVTEYLMKTLASQGGDKSAENKRDKFYNPVYVMAHSGARGSKAQISQLAGMRGLMAKPSGEIIETPITASFRDGLTVLQYFISTHGARKGLADTALKTANAGYLTRRLVDVSQDVIVTEEDCGTIRGIEMTALMDGTEVVESLGERIFGRYTLEDIYDPVTDELIVEADQLITEEIVEKIEKAGIDRVKVRSVLTCELEFGVCKKCYGMDLATRREVEIGEAVGIIAAQSIGEPGTQLTMRTFHIGGAASTTAEQSTLNAKFGGTIKFEDVRYVKDRNGINVVLNRNGVLHIVDKDGRSIEKYNISYGTRLLVNEGDTVKQGDLLAEWDPFAAVIMTEFEGRVAFGDIIEGETLKEDIDPITGLAQKVVISNTKEKRQPRISIKNKDNKTIQRYILPVGAMIMVEEGEEVYPGDVIAKIPRETQKTKDITVGLPRVAELFEARKPKEPAIISEIDGVVKIESGARGMRKIIVENEETGDKKVYNVSIQRYINVRDGDRVKAGEALVDGLVNPHDILAVLGEEALQKYLVSEIQEVYRKQGVNINDKHIEIIVRQMMRKVIIEDPGDSDYMPNEEVYKHEFKKLQEELLREGLRPPQGRPILQGITKAALNTESFISAASFQETTKVLTDAASNGKIDYLRGLKENVIMGKLIPAGTGVKHLRNKKFKFKKAI